MDFERRASASVAETPSGCLLGCILSMSNGELAGTVFVVVVLVGVEERIDDEGEEPGEGSELTSGIRTGIEIGAGGEGASVEGGSIWLDVLAVQRQHQHQLLSTLQLAVAVKVLQTQ